MFLTRSDGMTARAVKAPALGGWKRQFISGGRSEGRIPAFSTIVDNKVATGFNRDLEALALVRREFKRDHVE